MLAASVAPAAIGSGILMPVRKIIEPPALWRPPSLTFAENEDFTIEAWTKPAAWPPGSLDCSFELLLHANGAVGVGPTSFVDEIRVTKGVNRHAAVVPRDHVWHHIALTSSGLFVDGQLAQREPTAHEKVVLDGIAAMVPRNIKG